MFFAAINMSTFGFSKNQLKKIHVDSY